MTFVARRLGLGLSAVTSWERVPLEHVFKVARLLKVKPELLRPEFFADDPLRKAMPFANTVTFELKKLLTSEHGLIWQDRQTYFTNDVAAAAISRLVGREVTARQLIKRFGKSGRSKARRGRLERQILAARAVAVRTSSAETSPAPC